MNARQPKYKVIYAGNDITADLEGHLLSVSYTDKVSGSADEINLTIDDGKGLWKNQWIPTKGDLITVEIGYDDYLFPCGTFEVDELSLSGPPDIVTISAVAAGISKQLRTKNSYAHESKTLFQIASTIAKKHGLTITGELNNEIKVGRITQYQESDLSFLCRLSADFGYIFSVRNDQMVFTSIYKLEGTGVVVEFHRRDLSRYDIVDKTSESYSSAKVKYSDPENQELVEGSAECSDDEECASDELVLWKKAENVGQAEEIAQSALHNANTRKQTGQFSCEGNTLVLAGANCIIGGLGRLSGEWHILESTHVVSPAGYMTNFGAKKIKEIEQSKWL